MNPYMPIKRGKAHEYVSERPSCMVTKCGETLGPNHGVVSLLSDLYPLCEECWKEENER